jgi:hypothetical protein
VTFTLSPPVRIAALVGLFAAVVIGGSLMVLGRGSEEEPSIASLEAQAQQLSQAKPAAKPKASSKPAVTTPTKPAPTQRPVQEAPVTPAAVKAALAAGLPRPLANALGRNRAVVVSLYNPYSRVDAIAFAEARAGAQLAGAGFLPLNVLSKAQVGKLTEQLGLLPNPGLLVYVRPANLAARINGFADKETVAQAAHNAARGT